MPDIILNNNEPFKGTTNQLLKARVPIEPIHIGLLYHRGIIADPRNLANTGWHIPTISEFNTLAATCGGYSVAGGKLKETGTVYWRSPNTEATNESGFNFRSNGFRAKNGMFQSLTVWSYMLTASYTSYPSIYLILGFHDTGLLYSGQNENYTGFGARLICDSSIDPGYYQGSNGKIYRTVKIGNQVWLADNLAETKYRNGETIEEIQSDAAWSAHGETTGALCAFDNDWNKV